MLNFIPGAFKDFKNVIEYDRDSFATDVVINSLRTKNLDILQNNLVSAKGESLKCKGKICFLEISE